MIRFADRQLKFSQIRAKCLFALVSDPFFIFPLIKETRALLFFYSSMMMLLTFSSLNRKIIWTNRVIICYWNDLKFLGSRSGFGKICSIHFAYFTVKMWFFVWRCSTWRISSNQIWNTCNYSITKCYLDVLPKFYQSSSMFCFSWQKFVYIRTVLRVYGWQGHPI